MSDHHVHDGGHSGSDTTGVHGMLLFGEEVLYMSHLPMFASPHNFQVIVEVGFDDAVHQALLSDRHVAGDGIYTFVPRPFPIAELDPGDGGPARTSMEGRIFRGHFERGGKPITGGVVAKVEVVVYFNELDAGAQHAEDRELTYLCFGRARRLYLAHEVTARPNFDHVLTIGLVPNTATDQAGRPLPEDVATMWFNPAKLVQFGGRHDTPDSRLAPHKLARGFFMESIGVISGAHGFNIQVEAGRELYVEIRELT